MQTSFKIISGVLAAAITVAVPAQSQTSTARIDASQDWAVFAENNECWATSAPTKVVNSREGVVRSAIQLFVTYRKGASAPEVTFTGGYPFKNESIVKMQIGSSSYDLYADGEWAWPAPGDDAEQIKVSMMRGAEATLTAESARGTVTKDTFSLNGFTAAVTKAQEECT